MKIKKGYIQEKLTFAKSNLISPKYINRISVHTDNDEPDKSVRCPKMEAHKYPNHNMFEMHKHSLPITRFTCTNIWIFSWGIIQNNVQNIITVYDSNNQKYSWRNSSLRKFPFRIEATDQWKFNDMDKPKLYVVSIGLLWNTKPIPQVKIKWDNKKQI